MLRIIRVLNVFLVLSVFGTGVDSGTAADKVRTCFDKCIAEDVRERLICKQACYEEMEKHYEEELQATTNNGEDREPVQKCDASCPDEMAGGFGFYRLDDEFKEGVDEMNDE